MRRLVTFFQADLEDVAWCKDVQKWSKELPLVWLVRFLPNESKQYKMRSSHGWLWKLYLLFQRRPILSVRNCGMADRPTYCTWLASLVQPKCRGPLSEMKDLEVHWSWRLLPSKIPIKITEFPCQSTWNFKNEIAAHHGNYDRAVGRGVHCHLIRFICQRRGPQCNGGVAGFFEAFCTICLALFPHLGMKLLFLFH